MPGAHCVSSRPRCRLFAAQIACGCWSWGWGTGGADATCQPHPQRTQLPPARTSATATTTVTASVQASLTSWQPARGANRPGARHRATTQRCLGTAHPTAAPHPGGPGLGALGPCRAGRHPPARHQPTAQTGQPRANSVTVGNKLRLYRQSDTLLCLGPPWVASDMALQGAQAQFYPGGAALPRPPRYWGWPAHSTLGVQTLLTQLQLSSQATGAQTLQAAGS